ncbi:MAG TPA: Gfo/Idh/MocA family oxidoreductase [Candidatus Limnocylindrales bacterium]|nr:Gfo/Idh/MocA family oxidoreductase [Candidatus Limnocylindrales bacterium]
MEGPGTVRLGIIGTGRILDRFLPGARRSTAVEVLAIASRDADRARAAAAARGIPNAFGSYEALLADPGVDAVYICLPNSMHHSWTMRALADGKHVICEKPYSTDADEVDAAHDAADARGLVLTEGFMWRHGPHALRFVEELPRIGELRTIRTTFSFQIGSDHDIRLDRELAGGSLMDVGTYCVSASRLLAGREPVAALGVAWPAPPAVDERFSGLLDFGEGVVGTLTSGFRSEHSGIEAIGSDGSLRLDDPFAGRATKLVGSDGFVADIPKVDPYELELDDFAAAIRGEHPVRLGRADMLGQARALGALYESAATGRTVPV